MHFGPYTLDPKAYNLLKNEYLWKEGASWVFLLLNFAKIRQSFPLFYCKPAKRSQQTSVEYAPKHFKSALGKLTKNCRKTSK